MAVGAVQCPEWGSREGVKYGQQPKGAPRYRGTNPHGPRRIFLLQYHHTGWEPEVRQQRVAMALHGSGLRASARVRGVRPTTVLSPRKKSAAALPGESRAGDCS